MYRLVKAGNLVAPVVELEHSLRSALHSFRLCLHEECELEYQYQFDFERQMYAGLQFLCLLL